MRRLLVLAAVAAAGCGGSPSFTVGANHLDVADVFYQTKPTGYFCNGLFMNQVQIQLMDYKPSCGFMPDATLDHTELDLTLSPGGMPDFLLKPFPINMGVDCQTGGGPAYVVFQHFQPGKSTPDQTTPATGGTVKIDTWDKAKGPMKFTFSLNFGSGAPIKGSFNAVACN